MTPTPEPVTEDGPLSLWSTMIRNGKLIGGDWIAVQVDDTNALYAAIAALNTEPARSGELWLRVLAALGYWRDHMPPEDVAAVQRFVDLNRKFADANDALSKSNGEKG